jgi:GTP1/Obg family GTP-binding protein
MSDKNKTIFEAAYMFKLPTILTADELIDKAYKRGAKAKPVKDRDRVARATESLVLVKVLSIRSI